MKNILTPLLLIKLFSFSLAQDPPQLATFSPLVYDDNIIIDGMPNERGWPSYMVQLNNKAYYGNVQKDSTSFSASFATMWKAGSGLYVFAYVLDDTLVYSDDLKMGDNLEFFLHIPYSWDTPLRTETGAYQIASFHIQIIPSVKKRIQGTGNLTNNWKKLQMVEYAVKDHCFGYAIEIFFPFVMLFGLDDLFPKPEDLNETIRVLGFDIKVNDIDDSASCTKQSLAWNHLPYEHKPAENINCFGKIFLSHDVCGGSWKIYLDDLYTNQRLLSYFDLGTYYISDKIEQRTFSLSNRDFSEPRNYDLAICGYGFQLHGDSPFVFYRDSIYNFTIDITPNKLGISKGEILLSGNKMSTLYMNVVPRPTESIGKTIKGNDITAFPNPVTNTFSIKSENPFSQIQLIDLSGSVQSTKNFRPTKSATIDISQYKSGLYILKTISTNQTLSFIIITKQ